MTFAGSRQGGHRSTAIESEFNHHGNENRHVDEGDLYEIEKKADHKDHAHDHRKNRIFAVCVREPAQEFPHQGITAKAPENKTECSRPNQDDENHAGQSCGGNHDLAQNPNVEPAAGKVRTMAPTAPTAAASVGEAMPAKMEPRTAMMRIRRNKTLQTRLKSLPPDRASNSSRGTGGAMSG